MIEINDDETASRIYTEIDNATGDERMQMADALGKYGEKKLQEEYNTNDEHYSKMFMDDAYNQEYKGRSTAIKEAVNPDETWQRGTIQGYLSHRLGRDVTADNYEIERDAFSMSAFGQKNINDGQLFDNIKGDYEWQNKKTEALNDLHMQSVGKAINDSQLGQNRPFVDGMTDVFNTWQQKYPELVDGTNDAAFLSQGYKLYYDTINDLDSVRPQAAQTLTTLEKFTKGESDPEALQTLSNTLIGASPEERQKIYKYVTLAAEAGHIDRAGLDQFALNMGQSFTRGFDFVPQGSLQMQEAGVNNWLESIRNGTQIWVPVDGDLTKAVVGNAPAGVESDAWRQATVPEAETLIQSGQNVREGFKIVRELRNVAKTGVDPIRPVLEEDSFWGTAERGAYGLAGSIPLMGATAVNPFLGVIAYQANEYDRIMLENPDVNPQFAQGLALVEGAANAAIDRVQLKSLSGKLPMFGRYLDRIKSDGIRRTVKIGANVVEQNLQEGAQDLIAPVLETAVAALREDMPDKDFSSLMEGWAGQRAETFFATLPLALIGGGVATFRDIKHPSEELNATKLRMAGFSPEQTTSNNLLHSSSVVVKAVAIRVESNLSPFAQIGGHRLIACPLPANSNVRTFRPAHSNLQRFLLVKNKLGIGNPCGGIIRVSRFALDGYDADSLASHGRNILADRYGIAGLNARLVNLIPALPLVDGIVNCGAAGQVTFRLWRLDKLCWEIVADGLVDYGSRNIFACGSALQ